MNITIGMSSVLVAVLMLTSTAGAQGETAPAVSTVDQLVRLWKEREDRVQTLRVEFKRVHIEPGRGNPVELTGLLWIEGDRWRAQTSGPLWHDPSGRFINTNYVQLFDGSQYLMHFDRKERENDVFPWATFRSPDAPEMKWVATEPTPMPWILSFRNSHPVFSIITPEEWRIDQRTVMIDGLRCFAIIHKQHQFSGCVFWVTPDLDYRVLRREADLPDLFARDEIRYERDPEFGWVPSRWSETVHIKKTDGSLILDWDDQYTVEKLQINQPFPEDPFDYQVGEGTWVKDGAGGSQASRYLVREQGEKRPILDQELARGTTYTELLRTNPGEAGRPQRGMEVNWLLWGGVLLLAIALGAAYLQRQR